MIEEVLGKDFKLPFNEESVKLIEDVIRYQIINTVLYNLPTTICFDYLWKEKMETYKYFEENKDV